jgi:hypothetical protein
MKKNDVCYLRVRDNGGDARSIVSDLGDVFNINFGRGIDLVNDLTDEDAESGFLVLYSDGENEYVDLVDQITISPNAPPAQYHEVGREEFFDLCSCFPRKTRCISIAELFSGLSNYLYAAKDGDGTVYLYKNKPEYNEKSHEWFPVDSMEEYPRLSHAYIPGNSKDSLRKLGW